MTIIEFVWHVFGMCSMIHVSLWDNNYDVTTYICYLLFYS